MSAELYILTPPRIEPGFADRLEAVVRAGAATAVQIRLKDHAPDEVARLAPDLIAAARAGGAAAIVNDDPALAAKLGADGVHVGREDASVREARAAVGESAIVGATCHDSRHLAMLAGEQGADYVAFGAFFDTVTKTPKTRASLDILTWWSDLFEIPCVAIGGITLQTAASVIEAGADYLAVSGGIWAHAEGPEAAARGFASLLSSQR